MDVLLKLNDFFKSRFNIIITVDLILLLVTLYMFLISPFNPIPAYSFLEGRNRFMDFFNHIAYCEDLSNTYYVNYNANFPPFAYMFYKFFRFALPSDQIVMFHSTAMGPGALLVFVIYNVILFSLIQFNVIAYDNNSIQAKLIFLLFVVSYPTVFGVVERGNAAGIVLMMLLGACRLRDSNSKVDREVALLLIAMAAGFKVYPAVMGFLYVAEKRFKEATRLLLYGIVIFFGPFVLLGGYEGFLQFINNQMTLHNGDTTLSISIIGIIQVFYKGENYSKINLVISMLFLIMVLFSFILTTSKWKRVAMLVGIMTLIPKWSQPYTFVYYLVPLLMYACDKEKLRRVDYLYSFMFALINSSFLVNAFVGGKYLGAWLPIIGSYLLIFTIIGDEFWNGLFKNIKIHVKEEKKWIKQISN